jgi:hypothetical protein
LVHSRSEAGDVVILQNKLYSGIQEKETLLGYTRKRRSFLLPAKTMMTQMDKSKVKE